MYEDAQRQIANGIQLSNPRSLLQNKGGRPTVSTPSPFLMKTTARVARILTSVGDFLEILERPAFACKNHLVTAQALKVMPGASK